jgi:hypothetical protein
MHHRDSDTPCDTAPLPPRGQPPQPAERDGNNAATNRRYPWVRIAYSRKYIMKGTASPSVLIFPGAFDKPLLNDVIQAMRHVEAIMAINDDDAIEPGHLCGMSQMLANAEKVLGETRAALPAMRRDRRPPPGSSEQPGIGKMFTLSH